MSAAGMAALLMSAGSGACRSCVASSVWVKSLALDRMSWVPSGRPARAPHLYADRRFGPLLPFPPPDPANVILPFRLVLETTDEARQ
jgi:hypothetical protein